MPMDDDVKRAVRVIRKLTPAQKRELREATERLEKGGMAEDAVVRDSSLIMGPLSGTCPYCGRG